MKTCSKCGTSKPFEAFYLRKRSDGSLRYVAQCKQCQYSANRAAIVSDQKRHEARKAADRERYKSVPRDVHREAERKRHGVNLAEVARREQATQLAATGRKVCKSCASELPLSSFYSHPQSIGGVLASCKSCVLAQQKGRRDQLPESERKAIAAKAYWANPEKRRAEARRYREQNREACIARSAEHYKKNKERLYAASLTYKRSDPIRSQKYRKKWEEANPQLAKEIRRASKKKSVVELSYSYIRGRLGIKKDDGAPERLMDLKREQLRLKRLTRELDQAIKDRSE